MKKRVIVSIFAAFLLLPELSEASVNQPFTQTEAHSIAQSNKNFGGGKRNKNGRYRKKKGFLWGLFKGKNQCDCPK
ncbi:MAG: hypothetical protein MUF45_16915, partial [Spirosomaceae bacterium]|nr:hypothetical protein [Spirosomataceae bacterium]